MSAPFAVRPLSRVRLAGVLAALPIVPLLLFAHASARAQVPLDGVWATDGTVQSIASTGSTVFVGGQFNNVVPWTGSTARVDRQTAEVLRPLLRINGTLYAAVSDGEGGWYLGGSFTSVQGQPRQNLARLLADGGVSEWDPGADAAVYTLLLSGGTLYAGGRFQNVAGAARRRLASFDAGTGQLTGWSPSFTSTYAFCDVLSLLRSGNSLFVGGGFEHVNGQERAGVAEFDVTTGALTPLLIDGPPPSSTVANLGISGAKLFYQGSFSSVRTPARGIALVDPATGDRVPPRFDVLGSVKAIAPDGQGGWYVGGTFTAARGEPRGSLAHFHADGSLGAWNPGVVASFDSPVINGIAVNGDTVFVGGYFHSIGGKPRYHLAALDATADTALSMTMDVFGSVNALALEGRTLHVGGSFSGIGGEYCRNLASIDIGNGVPRAGSGTSANGVVRALAVAGGQLLAGGSFTSVGGASGSFVGVDPATGAMTTPLAGVVGEIFTALPDGAGGWFLGGAQSFVIRGQYRFGLAHLLADGTLSSWAPWVSAPVRALARIGGTLYAGGNFTTAASSPGPAPPGYVVVARRSLAAFDIASGALQPWNPGADSASTVTSMAALGDTLYVAGTFTQVGGQSRKNAASVGASSGAVTSWNPATPGFVSQLDVANGLVYVAGNFASIGGQPRTRVAALDPVTAAPTAWSPVVNGTVVDALEVSGQTVYVSGNFTTAGGAPRGGLAALDAATGLATAWNPAPNGTVASIAAHAGTVYVAGGFTQAGGQPRARIAALDAVTGAASAWNPVAGDLVNVVRSEGGAVVIGGRFTTLGTTTARQALAAFDLSSGAPTALDVPVTGTVYSLAVSGATFYVGGSFTSVGGQPRTCLAAATLAGAVTGWNPGANASVQAIVPAGSQVYVGGDFSSTGSAARQFLAALDATTGLATAWHPLPDAGVIALDVSGAGVLAGGVFTAFSAQERSGIAAVRRSDGRATSWNASPNSSLYDMAVRDGAVYAGGFFSTIGGASRRRIAALDTTSGAALPWNPGANGWVQSLEMSGDTLFVAGSFDTIAGAPRRGLVALDATSGALLSWAPGPRGSASRLAVAPGTVLVTGTFNDFGGVLPRANLAAFDAASGEPLAWNPGADGPVKCLALQGDRLYVGGEFTTIGGQPRTHLAALDTTTGDPAAWSPAPSARVHALSPGGSSVYVGGYFHSIGGAVRNFAAAIDTGTGLATAWNPNPNQTVFGLWASAGLVYAGGQFGTIGGQPRSYLAALDATTGQATGWNPAPNDAVFALAVTPDAVYAGGRFATIGGQSRGMLAALDPATGLATAFQANLGTQTASTYVGALHEARGTLFVGGLFGAGVSGTNVAALQSGTGQPEAWATTANYQATSFATARGVLYVGGAYSQIGGDARIGFAGFADPTSPGVTATPPAPAGPVLALAQNAPNPFARSSTIRFSLPGEGPVRLVVYDASGRVVRTLLKGERLPPGRHEVKLDAAGMRPGLYWYRLEWDGRALARRMVALP